MGCYVVSQFLNWCGKWGDSMSIALTNWDFWNVTGPSGDGVPNASGGVGLSVVFKLIYLEKTP